jgi:hypothetical protein
MEYEKFKPVEITIGRGQVKKEKNRMNQIEL